MQPTNTEARIPKEVQMQANTTDEILTVFEVAQRLRVASSWVYGHADLLGAYRLGKYLRFSWKRVLERLEAGEVAERALGSQPNDSPKSQ
jgi:hypothetical protein